MPTVCGFYLGIAAYHYTVNINRPLSNARDTYKDFSVIRKEIRIS